MPLIALCSVKGAPGVTTAALALAAALPAETRPVLIEADPAGGDLAGRFGLPYAPGLIDLAAASRSGASGLDTDVFDLAAQRVDLGGAIAQIVVAPAGGAQSRAAVPSLTQTGRGVLAPADRVVIVDCGRYLPGGPTAQVLAAADLAVVLVRGHIADVAHLREHLDELAHAAGDRLAVLLSPGGPYSATEVADVLLTPAGAVPVLGVLPHDPKAAAVLSGAATVRKIGRLALLRALEPIAADLAYRTRTSDATLDGARR